MTSRERVLTALGHREPDRVPVTLAYGDPDSLCRRYGKPEFVGRFRQDIVTVRFAEPQPPAPVIRQKYLPGLPQDATVNPWGVAHVPNDRGDAYQVISPLAGVDSLDALAEYPFPDLTPKECHEHLDRAVREGQARGFAVQGQMSQTIFEVSWGLCGMERTMMGLADDSRFVCGVFDRVLEQRLFQARRYAEAGVDILRLGDDVGSQKGMMLSPAMWREHLKPRLQRVIAAARAVRPGLPINYHSDGNIEEIIPDLIEIGVTILNPIQPECMDPATIKRKFGRELTLLGTVGTQTTLPFGSPDEVGALVAQRIRECGAGGGFIIAPTHEIRPEVPWENLVAFYRAVETHGRFPTPKAAW
jgi:uroporphyrinogen decarboxylase